ncbi:hypothetical protein, partial [Xylella fastidiosa]|uniref:hypothetical protein n=1 Tax=Xylella fastidiosa TaxID=2371 RepID=UPI001EEA8BC9
MPRRIAVFAGRALRPPARDYCHTDAPPGRACTAARLDLFAAWPDARWRVDPARRGGSGLAVEGRRPG